MTELVRKGNPYRSSDLVTNMQGVTSPRPSHLKKKSLNGADVGFCSRKSNLHLAIIPGYYEPVSLASQFYFGIGNAVHDVVFQSFKEMGILVANELPLFVGNIHGYIDDIIVSEDSGELKIIDVKTCGQLPPKIKVGQEEQLLVYSLLTGIKEASILYVSRTVAGWDGVVKMKEIAADTSPDNLRRVARIVAESTVYLARKIVSPKPVYRTSASSCGFCPFKDSGCWTDGFHVELSDGYRYVDEISPEITDAVEKLTDHIMAKSPLYYQQLLDNLATSKQTNRPVFTKWMESRK